MVKTSTDGQATWWFPSPVLGSLCHELPEISKWKMAAIFINLILATLALSLLVKMSKLCDIIALRQGYLEITTQFNSHLGGNSHAQE